MATGDSSRARVMIVDDHREMAEMLKDGLVDRGFDAVAVDGGREAESRLASEPFDALVTDLRMQPVDGLSLLARSRALDPERPVIIMTAFSAIDSAVEAIRQGAYHYLAKPFKLDELAIFLGRALDDRRLRREAFSLRKTLADKVAPPGMIGKSKVMRAVFERVTRLADTIAPVLITGETGTGKGMVASALHVQSRRAQGRFVTINCAALPEPLLESELFGHVKGAFTGATSARQGLFADANGGTLFLDEIGEMPLPLQAKLLHVLEHRRVRPVGGSKEQEIDVRIVAATHRDLRARVMEGTFREDLLYRLDVVPIEMPPLRQRPEDIPDLLEHFLASARSRYADATVKRFSRDALARLLDYAWPGNVRELAHLTERVVLLAHGEEVVIDDLPGRVRSTTTKNRPPFSGEVIGMREVQRAYAAWAYEQLGQNRTRTAERLGIDFKTLAKYLQPAPDDSDE